MPTRGSNGRSKSRASERIRLRGFMWWRLLASCRAINSAKFKVIQKIERALSFAMFAEEERHYKSSRRTGYKPLSRTKRGLSALFAVDSLLSATASAVVR